MEQEDGILRDSMSVRAKRWISERILNGTYPPGHRLIELQIARELKISQAPVREALRELEASGLVASEPFKGSRVRQVSVQEMLEAYQVRIIIEEHAAELAAPALRGNTAKLQSEADAAHEAARKGDIETFSRHNAAFHRHIVEACGNSIMLRFWDALQFEIRTQIFLSQEKLDPLEGERLHQTIIDAFDSGDGKLAGRLLREHLLQYSRSVNSTQNASPASPGRKKSPATGGK